MPVSQDEFVLRRDRLTIFVIGPGFGESVLVALPECEGWLVVDGAGPTRALPAQRVLSRHWTDTSSIELLLLTHPHADHYPGIDKLLDDPRQPLVVPPFGNAVASGKSGAAPDECLWIVELDDHGRETNQARGLAATTVVRA